LFAVEFGGAMRLEETIFLTGFPGFIAGRLVQELATSAVGTRFLLLVQPTFLERARHDIERISGQTKIPASYFRIIEGDITRADLGMSALDQERARAETTNIFHLAAIYDLGVARELAMRVNVEGTRHVNRFAQEVEGLRRYHYVSTCYVAGLREGLILETDLKHDAGFRNYYEETKYLAELEVEKLKAFLPVTIHRPAVVCGDSLTGETAKYDGIYYLIHYLLKWPRLLTLFNIGNREVKLNLVPVDFVVAGMAALAHDEYSIGKTVQLADPNPLTTHELFEAIAIAMNHGGSRLTIPAPVVHNTLRLPLSPRISGMPHAAVPYFFLDQSYDTTQARSFLDPYGIRCPPFKDYAQALVDFAMQHPRL
jgi:thioester reductase-like protein